MNCPRPEILSQWTDGSLDRREAQVVGRHVEDCDACRRKGEELRAAGDWVASAAEAGPSCLSAEEMASVIEGLRVPPHVRTCPRCAAEYRALKPDRAERKATRRRPRPDPSKAAWVAAAAIFVAVGILLVVANRQEQFEKPAPIGKAPVVVEKPEAPVPAPPPVVPAPPLTKPDMPATAKLELPPPPPPPPVPEAPAPVVEKKPQAPKPSPVVQPAPEVVEPGRSVAALNVRSGALQALTDGKWVKTQKPLEGMALRAEGRTQVEFAQARITLDASSRFAVAKDEFSLAEGAMSADVASGSKFVLVLDEQRIVPQTFNARVLFCARPDRVVVEEGSAKWNNALVQEGVEHVVKKGQVEPQKRRTLPAALRARETPTWRVDFAGAAAKKLVWRGRVVPEERMMVSEPIKDDATYYGQVGVADDGSLFTVKPNTAIRFRYYLMQPGHLELVMWNVSKGENFNKPLEPVVRQWTTVTIPARDLPANRGGKPVTCEVGDKFTSIGWFVGLAGAPTQVYIDRLEILEIDR